MLRAVRRWLMFSFGIEKLLMVMLVALLVLGPEELPKVMRQAGRVNADYRRIVDGLRREIDEALNPYDEPTTAAPPLPPTLGELATAIASDHEASSASAYVPTDSAEEPQP